MVLMLTILSDYCIEVHWNYMMLKLLDLNKATIWDLLIVKCLALYLEMYMESNLGLMLKYRWVP